MTDKGRASIVILTHSSDDFWEGRPFVQLMMPVWEQMGIKSVVVTEQDEFVPADFALLHVDLSVVPDSCLRVAGRYPAVLNGRVRDIRKRLFSRHLLRPDEPCDGEVIVKTNWNHGGWREFRRGILESSAGPLLRRFKVQNSVCRKLARLESKRPWSSRSFIPPDQYPVFANREAVPGGVWGNPNLVVQRFIAEREGNDYCCRHWIFFGSEEVHRRSVAPHPTVKGESARTENLADPVPEELRAIREQMGFDYGKFDYGIAEGQVVLYDVNRTPGTHLDAERHARTLAVLSRGLCDVLATAGARPPALAAGC